MPMPKTNLNREQITQFVVNNKKDLIIGSIILVVGLLILAVLLKFNQNLINQNPDEQMPQQTDSAAAPGSDSGTLSTYLPDIGRKLDAGSEIRDPFTKGMVLKGIITGGSGGNLAIIESGNTAFVAGLGEEIAGGWTVAEIKRNVVILTLGTHKFQLEFNGRVKDLTTRASLTKPATNQSAEQATAAQSSVPSSGETPWQITKPPAEPETISPAAQDAKHTDNPPPDTAGKEGVNE